jgi:cyclase
MFKHFVSGVLFCFSLLVSPSLFADSSITHERTVTKLADGVYVIRHKDAPDAFPQGNTTVIIGDKEVFVVDACYLPSSASEDIAQIRTWTNKPVRYLLNTHWHYDHTMGNGVYAAAFPSLTIIAHHETRKQMEGYNPGWFERFPTRAATFRQYLETGKDGNGKVLTDSERKEYEEAILGIEPVHAEFKKLVDKLPGLTFDSELTVDIGNREVQIKHLGRGNTAGDAIVYLPKERILVAGDLLDHPIPYLGGGYPSELITTLKRMSQMDIQAIVPGHGDVLNDKTHLTKVIEFVSLVVAQVSKEVHRLGNNSRKLDEVQEAVYKSLDLEVWRKAFAGDNTDDREFFDSFSLPGLIKASFAETWRR